MNSSERQEVDSSHKPGRRSYSKPQLQVYGGLRDITLNNNPTAPADSVTGKKNTHP
jgi:hypothetical protein